MQRKVNFLGPLSITDDGRPCDLVRNAKGCALLTYLIVHGRPESREHLADLFWDSTDTASSLRNLRVLLTRVRPLLPGLDLTRTSVQYLPQADEAIDYVALAGDLTHGGAGTSLGRLRLYRGELLQGFHLEDAPRYMEWLALHRERLRRAVLDAHRSLCQALADKKRWPEGAEVAAHWLTIDEVDEEALRWQLQFLAAQGNIAAARQAYAAFQKVLGEDWGLQPEAATQALAQELDNWSGGPTALLLPASSSLGALSSGELSEPGPLPVNAILPYHRNEAFVGQETELLQISSAFAEGSESGRPTAVAITGIGGLGKTQTAVEFCYRYGRYFSGGVFWLNFSEPKDVAGEAAATASERGLGLFLEKEKLTLADQIGRVRRAWQEPVPRLLVFDNCEDAALLEQWLPVTGGCRVLLTCRQSDWPAGLGVKSMPLRLLGPLESSQLLQRLAPHLSDSAAGEIARVVGHLPLALYLAGSFLCRYKQISPAAYLTQLRDDRLLRHPSLQGRGTGHSPTGHALSVARTYILNWERLNPADDADALARQLLAHSACLAPNEPIPAGWLKAVVCGDRPDTPMTLLAEDGLSRLVALGFLRCEDDTVVLHPILAAFTMEACGTDETRKAQITVVDRLTQTLSEHRQRTGNLSLLPVSTIHLRHVSEMALDQQLPGAAGLAAMLGLHLEIVGNLVDAERVLQQACAVAAQCGDILGQARALSALASTQESLNQAENSLQSATHAAALFKDAATHDAIGLTDALYYQGWAHFRLEHAEETLKIANEGRALSQASSLRRAAARFLGLLGVVYYYMLGRYESAQIQLTESLDLYREIGHRQGEGTILNNMGESARLQGNYALAAQHYEEALVIANEICGHNYKSVFLSNLCGARIGLGQFAAAARDLEILIAKTRHDWHGLSEAYRLLASAYLGLGKNTPALEMAQQALALADQSNVFAHGRAWRVLGLVASQLGQPILPDVENDQTCEAADCFRRSLEFLKVDEFDRDRAITLWHWARHEMKHGNEIQGQAMCQDARALFARLNLPLMVAQTLTDASGQSFTGEQLGSA